MVGSEELVPLASAVDALLSDATQHSHQLSTTQLRYQRLFAIKAGTDGLLDAARVTMSEVTDDLHALFATYERDHPLPDMKLAYTAPAGYHLTSSASPDVHDPSSLFINVRRHRRQWKCTTLALVLFFSLFIVAVKVTQGVEENEKKKRSN